jgi:hypothetical protein
MKIKSAVVLASALAWAECSNGTQNNAAMLASVNAYTAAHPICDYSMPDSVFQPRFNSNPAPWEVALLKAGLFVKKPLTNPALSLYGYMLAPAPRLQIVDDGICSGHVVADAIVKTEPITDAEAGYAGISKDALVAEFETHFQYADWATTPQLRTIIDKTFINQNALSAEVPALRLVVYDDPIRKWMVLGRQ